MFRIFSRLLVFLVVCLPTIDALAHFGMVIPSKNIVDPAQRTVGLTLAFSHPFEGIGMDLPKPNAFYMVHGDKKTDLLTNLQQTEVMGKMAWSTKIAIKRPAVYQFIMEPTPYWEPAEDLFIIHYTKTLIAAFGREEGWDEPVGLATEIVPLSRPFANYAGNTFTGQVLLNGKPVAFAEVEVEYYNQGKAGKAPSDYHITQVVKADDNGIFNFSCPEAGWWGFAALNEADYTLKTSAGEEKGVELGAVIWVYLDEWPGK